MGGWASRPPRKNHAKLLGAAAAERDNPGVHALEIVIEELREFLEIRAAGLEHYAGPQFPPRERGDVERFGQSVWLQQPLGLAAAEGAGTAHGVASAVRRLGRRRRRHRATEPEGTAWADPSEGDLLRVL